MLMNQEQGNKRRYLGVPPQGPPRQDLLLAVAIDISSRNSAQKKRFTLPQPASEGDSDVAKTRSVF
jgi:hypothetical protein